MNFWEHLEEFLVRFHFFFACFREFYVRFPHDSIYK
jgi:hypothetical protein